MSKAIASYPEEQRLVVIRRRLAGKERGNGYWAAVDGALKLRISLSKFTKSETQSLIRGASVTYRDRSRHAKVDDQQPNKKRSSKR